MKKSLCFLILLLVTMAHGQQVPTKNSKALPSIKEEKVQGFKYRFSGSIEGSKDGDTLFL